MPASLESANRVPRCGVAMKTVRSSPGTGFQKSSFSSLARSSESMGA